MKIIRFKVGYLFLLITFFVTQFFSFDVDNIIYTENNEPVFVYDLKNRGSDDGITKDNLSISFQELDELAKHPNGTFVLLTPAICSDFSSLVSILKSIQISPEINAIHKLISEGLKICPIQIAKQACEF